MQSVGGYFHGSAFPKKSPTMRRQPGQTLRRRVGQRLRRKLGRILMQEEFEQVQFVGAEVEMLWQFTEIHGNPWMLLCVKSFKSCKCRETSKWYRFMVHVWIEGGCFATCILFLECLVKGWKVMPVSVYKMSDGREVSPDFLNGPLCDVQPEAIHCFCFSCFMVKLHLTFHSLMQFNHFNELPSCLPQIPRPKDPQKEALAIYKRYEDELLSEAWYQDGKAFRISSPKDSTLVMSLSPCFLNLFAAKKQQNESDRMAVYDDSL